MTEEKDLFGGPDVKSRKEAEREAKEAAQAAQEAAR